MSNTTNRSVASSRRQRIRRRKGLLIGVVTAMLLAGGTGSNVAEATVPNSSIVGSYCTGYMNWAGSIPTTGPANYFVPSQPRGTVRTCFFKYRITDQDNGGDYYAGEAVTEWTLSAGNSGYSAPMSQSISSNRPTINGVYTATGSIVGKSCTSPITLSITLGGLFSMSVTPTVCSGTTVSRNIYTSTSAGWGNSYAGKLRSVETQFAQKVTNGTVPTFTFRSVIPQYLVNSCTTSSPPGCAATTTARSTTVTWTK